MLVQEHWAAGTPPTFSGNPYDVPSGGGFQPSIAEYNAQIQASALAHGCQYVDVRAAAALAESVQNTPAPGIIDNVLTLAADGIHPSAAGQLVMSSAIYPLFTFTS